jgi:hypothetical protein
MDDFDRAIAATDEAPHGARKTQGTHSGTANVCEVWDTGLRHTPTRCMPPPGDMTGASLVAWDNAATFRVEFHHAYAAQTFKVVTFTRRN